LRVTSANPAGGSSAHDNVSISVCGAVALDALESVFAVINGSLDGPYVEGWGDPEGIRKEMAVVRAEVTRRVFHAQEKPTGSSPRAQWLTEDAVRRAILRQLAASVEGDEIVILMFYLSDRGVIREIVRAAESGANIRVILDVNRDAFGREKIGIPNRPVAGELEAAGRRLGGRIQVRWAETHGEQFHIKAMAIRNSSRSRQALLAGSANWTRRNLRNLNLEANLLLENSPDVVQKTFETFDRLWNNDGAIYTTDFNRHAETGWTRLWKTALGRFQEATGAGSF
ncbi:MAG: phospholipase D-like domain-containing protein, partial [Kiritimatiellia bacterium]|nr:phospholipase D-like domain-containing protein [Kiritimatiellia bacterium]